MQHKKWAFIISGIVVLCCVSACGSFTDNEEKEISSNKWLDEKDYKNRLLENRVPISEYREDYKLETERIRNADYENLSFSSAEFADFPDGEEVSLTPTEYEILKLLMEHAGQVFSPREIYTKIWNDLPYGSENTVAVHIRHLREKLEINPAEPRYLKVVWGQGYKCEKKE